MTARTVPLAMGLLLLWGTAGCTNVQVLRLTSETFPSREVEDVAILSRIPSLEYEKIAELSETSSSDNIEKLQRHLLNKAAELGAERSCSQRRLRTRSNVWRISRPITHGDTTRRIMARVPTVIGGRGAIAMDHGDRRGAISKLSQCRIRYVSQP